MGRIIFHIDMNSFFVSCEIAKNPKLQGKMVAVAPQASSRKSIILAASYEAKAKGIKTTMHVNEALRICPNLIIVDSNYNLYSEYSRMFFSYFLTITKLVEPASIDEGFLDVTEVCEAIDPLELAIKIQNDILNKLHLPCSIGIGPNKFLAKMASDMKKPLGITILRKREVETKLWPLPVSDLLGVGKKTLPILNSLNIHTIGDLANYKNIKELEENLGKNVTKSLLSSCRGEGSDIVDTNRHNESQSISNSITFDVDEYDVDKVKKTLKLLTNQVCSRLEKHRYLAQTFTVQIKYNNFKLVSKSKTIEKPINEYDLVYKLIDDLFDDLHDLPLGIRLVGVGASKFNEFNIRQKQMTIFDSFDKYDKEYEINKLINSINESFGKELLKKGIKDKKI